MFYLFVGFVVVGYLAYCGFCRVRCKTLVAFCPLAVILPLSASLLLYFKGHELTAGVVLLLGVILSTAAFSALRKVLSQQKLTKNQNA